MLCRVTTNKLRLNMQLLQLRKDAWKNSGTGFETLTSAITVQRSTNWANKPTGSRSLNVFRLPFRNWKRCFYNCDDLLSYKLFVLTHNWEPHQADHTFWPLISSPKITSITGQKQLINGWQEIETTDNTNQNYDTTLNSNTTPKTHEGWMGGWGRSGNGRWQQKLNSTTPRDLKIPVHSNLYAIRVLEKRFPLNFFLSQWKTTHVLMRTY